MDKTAGDSQLGDTEHGGTDNGSFGVEFAEMSDGCPRVAGAIQPSPDAATGGAEVGEVDGGGGRVDWLCSQLYVSVK